MMYKMRGIAVDRFGVSTNGKQSMIVTIRLAGVSRFDVRQGVHRS